MNIKSISFILILSILVINADAQASIANHVFIEPADKTVNLGETFSIILKGEDFNLGMDGGSIDMAFDPMILNADSVSINSGFWNVDASKGSIDNDAGKIDFTDVAQFGSNTTNTLFDIATFTFHANGIGSSQLILKVNDNSPFATGGDVIAVNLSNGLIIVQAIPLPAAIWLFATALIGLGVFSKRKESGK